MKELHLLCNAHLDPAWLWRWNEGMAEAISTFRVAADFCEKYDGFVFNHNEAVLYEYIEEHDPVLFSRIKKLVAEKKWAIVGGWYLQPDCVMLSGESFIEQINLGREFFESRFGVTTETAINFDPFGHSRGLAQILKKCGYKNYIFMRPCGAYPGNFIWEGFDGSQIFAHGLYFAYSTHKGKALQTIKAYLQTDPTDIGLCPWGVGNHGGGPSRIDLEAINEFQKTSDVRIIHSTADEYFKKIDKTDLKVVKESLLSWAVGCYTSMVRIKQAHRRLENKIAKTEKIMSFARMNSNVTFDVAELKKAKKALAFCQFHDILPGSAIAPVEEDSLQTFAYGEEIVDKLYNKAFIKLCDGQSKAAEGEIPVMVFNPHPYEVEGVFEVEFLLQNQNWNEDEITIATAYDEQGNKLPTQNEKPACTINLDWVKRISFIATVAPSCVSRFNCKLEVLKKSDVSERTYTDDTVSVVNERMRVSISKKTGLIEFYEVDGKRYIENSGILEVFKDDEDPWGMKVNAFKNYEGCFNLMAVQEANAFIGYPEESTTSVRIVENGDVRTKVEALFAYGRSIAVVTYTIPKQGTHIDVNIVMYSNEPNKMIKYRLDSLLQGKPYGETAFGYEELYDDERESVFHKWCGIRNEDNALYVVNNGIYGGSFTDNCIKLSLLRTPIYAAHPIQKRQIAPHDRFVNHIDMGERHFSFRITTEKNIAREAQIYNEAPELISIFTSGEGEKKTSAVTIDNPEIILSSFRANDNGYELHLHNAADHENDALLSIPATNTVASLHFGKHELKIMKI